MKDYYGDNNIKPKKKTSLGTILSRILIVVISLLLLYFIVNRDAFNKFYIKVVENNLKVSELNPNQYFRDVDYEYVQITDDFVAKDKQHLYNIFYTLINSGENEFKFLCGVEYVECMSDVKDLVNDKMFLASINAFIHPYNSFSGIKAEFYLFRQITINLDKYYTNSEIIEIDSKINYITDLYKNEKDIKNLLKLYHNHIIRFSKYDVERAENGIINYRSETAYGNLIQGYGLCGGYTDSLALLLNYHNIPNFKINSKDHVWNVVYIDNNWYHIDLTWDDPVTTNGTDVIRDNYFLLTTDELLKVEQNEHNFDTNIFRELKK